MKIDRKVFNEFYSKNKRKILKPIYNTFIDAGEYFNKLVSSLTQSKTVLEIGCGRGDLAIQIAKNGARKVVGVDISDEAIKIAKDKLREEKLSKLNSY